MECILSGYGDLGSLNTFAEVRDNRGRTPFLLACMHGQYEMAEILLQAGKADPTVKNLITRIFILLVKVEAYIFDI